MPFSPSHFVRERDVIIVPSSWDVIRSCHPSHSCSRCPSRCPSHSRPCSLPLTLTVATKYWATLLDLSAILNKLVHRGGSWVVCVCAGAEMLPFTMNNRNDTVHDSSPLLVHACSMHSHLPTLHQMHKGVQKPNTPAHTTRALPSRGQHTRA
ncbi:hypothetical protein BJV77DRAFT_984686 [Russula vinacea]|nr:hypothetical protein BJV77DRAFT_984686 [Russula vinacea]